MANSGRNMPTLTRRSILGAGAAGVLLSGCRSAMFINDYDSMSFELLLRQIKYDVGSYMFEHRDDPAIMGYSSIDDVPEEDREEIKALVAAGEYRFPVESEKCWSQVNLRIKRIKMTVTTSTEQKQSGSLGLQVPIGISTLNLTGSMGAVLSNTLATTIQIFSDEDQENVASMKSAPPPVEAFEGRKPICDALNKLQKDIYASSDTLPCFSLETPGVDNQKENVVKWGFTVVRNQGGGGKFSLLLFSLGAEASQSLSAANTVEVYFAAEGGLG